MRRVNVEIKARCEDAEAVRRALRARGAEFRGTDHQVDTYFHTPRGRLKLREGRIENHLIFYRRDDQPGPKRSDVLLLPTPPGAETRALKALLTEALSVLAVVDKRREIYFVENVKFHLDDVAGLGRFLEIEAQGDADAPAETLRDQCREYLSLFATPEELLVPESYSDLILRGRGGSHLPAE